MEDKLLWLSKKSGVFYVKSATKKLIFGGVETSCTGLSGYQLSQIRLGCSCESLTNGDCPQDVTHTRCGHWSLFYVFFVESRRKALIIGSYTVVSFNHCDEPFLGVGILIGQNLATQMNYGWYGQIGSREEPTWTYVGSLYLRCCGKFGIPEIEGFFNIILRILWASYIIWPLLFQSGILTGRGFMLRSPYSVRDLHPFHCFSCSSYASS